MKFWPFLRNTTETVTVEPARYTSTRLAFSGYQRSVHFEALNSGGEWYAQLAAPNRQNRFALAALKNASRWLADNDPYYSRFLKLQQINVIGADGMQLQARISDPAGNYNTIANKAIEDAWADWSEHYATLDGCMSFRDIEQLLIRLAAMDGETFVRIVTGAKVNPFGVSLMVLDSDLLDVQYNGNASNGNQIVQGIEVDALGKRVAYHFWNRHPQELETRAALVRQRIDAGEVIHVYKPDRPGQFRGLPWGVPGFRLLAQLHAYVKSELVAANAAANQLGSITSPATDTTQYLPGTENTREALATDAGQLLRLAPGEELNWTTVTHPSLPFQSFINTLLHGVASAWNTSYSSLCMDSSQENYASGRISVIENRDHYKNIQAWMIRTFHEKVFTQWLECALATKALDLPEGDYSNVTFRARGWKWADPKKDLEAYETAISNNLLSKTQICAEQGLDYREVLQERYHEQKLEAEIRRQLIETDGLEKYLDATLVADSISVTEKIGG